MSCSWVTFTFKSGPKQKRRFHIARSALQEGLFGGGLIQRHIPTSLLASDHDVLVLAQAADWPEQQENCLRGVGESFSSHWTTLAGRAPNRSVFKAPAGKLTYQLSVV